MAMGINRSKGDINVTPMIDVLLVLLIIFMVIIPTDSVGLDVQIPQQAEGQSHPLPSEDIVLTVLGGGKVRLDQMEVEVAKLPERLREILTRHTAGVAFVKGRDDLDFAEVAEVIDVAKGNGWKRIGLMPR